MKLYRTSTYEQKKSKFIAYYYDIDDVNEVADILAILKDEHKKARHIPYAYKVGTAIKKCDDGEPSGTAGNPLLNVIMHKNLDHILIVVVRYFGGVKLGTGGLTRAYSHAASALFQEEL